VGGLSRAAIFALGTGTAALTGACSSGSGAPADAGNVQDVTVMPMPAYGGVPTPVGDGGDAGNGFDANGMMGQPAYGGTPMHLDSGLPGASED
jgi:hypothetical protein